MALSKDFKALRFLLLSRVLDVKAAQNDAALVV